MTPNTLGTVPVSPGLYLSSASGVSKVLGIQVAMPGYLPFTPGNAIPFGGPQNLGQVYEDVNWVRGAHTFRFGGQYIYIRDNRAFGAYEEAVEQMGTNLKQGMDNLLTGQLFNFQSAVDPQGKFPGDVLTLPVSPPDFTRSNRYSDGALYAQDSWRIMPNLTANLGVRWEYYGVQHNKDPFKDSNYYLGSGSSFAQQVANGSVQLAPNSPVGGLWQKDLDNFAPRVGVAWDVFGNGKTSLRGGYGISYERNFGNVTFNVIQNPPNYAVISLHPADVGGNLPISTDNAGPLAGNVGTKTLPPVTLRAVDPNMETAYAHIWSVALEHEITKNTLATLEYTGSKGHGLYTINRVNTPGSAAVFLGNPDSQAPLNPLYSLINFRTDDGLSRYNAVVAEVSTENLLNSGVQFRVNYTYSHSLDNISDTFSGLLNNANLGLLDPTNPLLDYGSSDFDVRHRISVSGIWDVPFAKNMKGIGRQVLGGWSFAPIFSAHTGAPYSIYDCTNAYATCNRVILTSPINMSAVSNPAPVTGTPNTFTYLDLSSLSAGVGYANAITGYSDFGPYPVNMAGRNTFRQPGYWDFTLGAYKSFKLPKEGTSLQFRAEFYNLFNHSNLYADISQQDISSTTFIPAYFGGKAGTSAAERRNIQFAMKFIF